MDHAKKIAVKIKKDSWLAHLAAVFMRSSNMAMVIGNTIYLHGVTAEFFLANKRWVRHELKHVEQFQERGTLTFLLQYNWEYLRKGYKNNRYEIEARLAEEENGREENIAVIRIF